MGTRNTSNRQLVEELARIKRHIDQAVLELSEARARMTAQPGDIQADQSSGPTEADMSTLCISLDLALSESVSWARRLAEKVRSGCNPAEIPACRRT